MNCDALSENKQVQRILTASHLVLIVLVAFAVIFPSFYLYGGTDWGHYVNVGRQLSEGHLPYTECWTHKPPLLYFYLAAWFSIFGATWSTANWALLPIYSTFGIGVYSCYRSMLTNKWMALGAAMLALLVLQRWDWDRNGAIVLLATAFELFSLTCFWMSVQATDSKNTVAFQSFALAAGLLAGAAFCTRASGLAAFAPPLLWWFYYRDRGTFKLGLTVAFGVCLCIFSVAGFCALLGISWEEFWRSNVTFNARYAAKYRVNFSVHRFVEGIRLLSPLLWAFTLGATVFAWQKNDLLSKDRGTRQMAVRLLLGQLLVVLILRVLAAKIIPYYNYAILPYIVILAVFTMTKLAEMCRPVSLSRLAVAAIILALMYPSVRDIYRTRQDQLRRWKASLGRHQLVISEGKGRYRLANLLKGFDPSKLPDGQVINRVQERLEDDDDSTDDQQVFVYGSRAWLYFLGGFRSPLRYHARPGMFGNMHLTPDEFMDTVRTLEEKKPRFVVRWNNSKGRQPDEHGNSPVYDKPIESMTQDEYFDSKFLSNYRVVDKFQFVNEDCWPYGGGGPVYIYERRESKTLARVDKVNQRTVK